MSWLGWAVEIVAAGALVAHALFQGIKTREFGALPTEHQLHETLEIAHGFTDWFETGFYVFSSAQPGEGWQWVGDHIRPRFAIPQSWRWPVGLSLSTEIGYQRPLFVPDTWTWEVRPIIDKNLARWYLAFNPTFAKSLHGPSAGRGWEFAPNVKVSYEVSRVVAAGFEYYGALGPLESFDPLAVQQQQIFPVIDLNFGPQWEFNFGVGIGLTGGADHLLVKLILGRRFGK